MLLVVAAVVFSAQARIRTALADPNFDVKNPRRMLWSDPALLYYFTERIVENGGTSPDELRADRHFQHPEAVDALAFETVGQEYVAAWWHLAHRKLGGSDPLHVSCTKAMAWAASLAAIGVALLAAELTGSALLGGLAALLFALIPANYRTIGFILIREDFALPWFVLHLGLLARAARVRTRTSFVACGLALLAALSTWHAMGFVVALEAAVVFGWFLLRGENALAARGAWLVPAVVAVGSFCVPVLRAKIAALSLPMQAAAGLLAAAAFAKRRPQARGAARLVAIGGAVAAAIAAWAASKAFGGGIGDYSHVLRLMVAKVRFLGELPRDPRLLDFEARLLWQGPFETGSLRGLATELSVGFVAMLWLVVRPLFRLGRPSSAGGSAGGSAGAGESAGAATVWLAWFGVLALATSWLVVRTTVVAGLVAPVAVVVVIASLPKFRWRSAGVMVALVVATASFVSHMKGHRIGWYGFPRPLPDGRVTWIAHPRQSQLPPLLAFLEQNVPLDAPIGADLVNSTAILAHTRRPILLQPKYESRESRRRIEEFLETFFHHSTADFAAMLARYGSRHVVIDRGTLGAGSKYYAGIKDDGSEKLDPSSASAYFLEGDAARVPGFKLVWRSPPALGLDLYRVYEVE